MKLSVGLLKLMQLLPCRRLLLLLPLFYSCRTSAGSLWWIAMLQVLGLARFYIRELAQLHFSAGLWLLTTLNWPHTNESLLAWLKQSNIGGLICGLGRSL